MPRYYFHLRDGGGYVEDEEGQDLPALDHARREAVRGARSIISDDVLHGRLDLDGVIDVTDGDGKPLLTVAFREAVERPA